MIFNRREFERTMTDLVTHYEQSAPALSSYLDDLYVRVNESSPTVLFLELRFVDSLTADGEPMHPNYAQNQLYHLLVRLGRETTGMADHRGGRNDERRSGVSWRPALPRRRPRLPHGLRGTRVVAD